MPPLPKLAELDKELVRRGGLRAFVKLAWPLVEPRTLLWGWHLDEICVHLEAVSRGECKRLLINIPPGFSKTLITNVLWPAWDWLSHPTRKFISASYGADLAHGAAKRMRELVQGDWFQERWGKPYGVWIPTRAERKIGNFKNNCGGFRFSTGVGGGVIGWHADVHIYDDPHKTDEVQGSADAVNANLEKVRTWYRETIASRAVDLKALAKVLIMQRLHENDLSGVCLAEGGWTHLCLPIAYTTTGTKLISLPSRTPWGGDRREVEGEMLCEARVSAETNEAQRITMGSHAHAAQYGQVPSNSDGNVIKRTWLGKVWTALPAGGRWIQSWDMAFKAADSSSFVVGQVWYYKDGEYFLVDQVREQMGFSATVQAVITLSAKHPKALAKIVEAKANGPAVVDVLSKKVSGLLLVEPEGGKEARLQAVSPLFEAGNVYLPDPATAPWVHDYIEELATFPGAPKDDQVDCTSQALLHLSLKTTNLAKAMAQMRAQGVI